MIAFSRQPGSLLFLLLLLTSCIPIVSPPTAFPTIPLKPSPTFPPAISPPTVSPTIYPTVSPTAPPTEAFHLSLEAFTINDQCLHICWLGINPGVTTVEEARALLRASDQIDQKNFYATATYIQTNWFFQEKTWYCQAVVDFGQGRAKTIALRGSVVTMDEIIHLFGEPDKIKIGIYESPHEDVVAYALYYSSRKTLLYAVSRGWDGPNPNDNVNTIILNTDEFGSESDAVQPWSGYGHLRDYLPGAKIPTATP